MKRILIILVLLRIMCESSFAQQVLRLYPDTIPNSKILPDSTNGPTLQLFLPKSPPTETTVIIFPGGGYTFLAYKEEGIEVAKSFAARGITAFVVKYRLPSDLTLKNKSYGPLMDAQQAIKYVRSRASQWNIDPNKIGIVGYSAGGHLASTLGCHFTKSYISNNEDISLRPDFMILVYPVISMQDQLTHLGSRTSLLGIQPTKEEIEFFSNEQQVTKDTPPTYLTHTGDDELVDVNNSIVFYQALQKNGVDAELHLFPKGNHGFTQRLPVNEWLEPMLEFLKREGFYK